MGRGEGVSPFDGSQVFDTLVIGFKGFHLLGNFGQFDARNGTAILGRLNGMSCDEGHGLERIRDWGGGEAGGKCTRGHTFLLLGRRRGSASRLTFLEVHGGQGVI